ncbi:ead/Ea22-like family protein [Enterobacter hormaechei]
MSNIDNRVLREAAVRAGGVKWQYMRATQHSKAYITDDKGSTVINCTDGDVPAKCAGFLESANPAAVLALLDELEAAEKRIAELQNDEVRQRLANAEHQLHMAELAKHNLRASRKAQFRKRKVAERRIAELEAREVKFPELKMLRDYLAEVTMREREDILVGVRLEFFRALEEAGVKAAAAAGKGE